LIASDPENSGYTCCAIEGHGQPGDRQALRVDVSLNGITSGAVHLLQPCFGSIVIGRIAHRVR